MYRIVHSVEQLAESKTLILRGTLPSLRMALLLLDNAAEVLMHRATEQLIAEGRSVLRTPYVSDDPEHERWRISRATAFERRRDLRKYFNAKASFLSEVAGVLSKSPADALIAIHRYRNEAYHRDHVRRETIHPVVMVLFDIVCDLLVTLKQSSWGFSGQDDFTSFQREYDLPSGMSFSPDDHLPQLREILKSGLPLNLDQLREGLRDHLNSRIEDMLEMIDYIDSNNPAGHLASREEVLELLKSGTKYQQDYEELGISKQRYEKSITDTTIESFQKWKEGVASLTHLTDKLTLLTHFAKIETDIEPIESLIQDAVAELDELMNLQVDEMRMEELMGRQK